MSVVDEVPVVDDVAVVVGKGEAWACAGTKIVSTIGLVHCPGSANVSTTTPPAPAIFKSLRRLIDCSSVLLSSTHRPRWWFNF